MKMWTIEQWRMVTVSVLSPVLGYYTPTGGFVLALVIMFAFNIWSGMRADGVVIRRYKNFSFRKFKNALLELLLYLVIIEVIFTIMVSCGDKETSIIAVKSLTYVFMYVYLQNSFRNLIIAYPRIVALHIVYHLIRFEFLRALPDNVKSIIEKYDESKTDDNTNS